MAANGWRNRASLMLYTNITDSETETRRVTDWFKAEARQRADYNDAVDAVAGRLEGRVIDIYDSKAAGRPIITDVLLIGPDAVDIDYRRIVSMIVDRQDYAKMAGSPKASQNRSPGSGRRAPPKKSQNLQPRDSKGRFKKKPKSGKAGGRR